MTVLEAVKILFFLHHGDKNTAVEVVEKECRMFLRRYARSQSWRHTAAAVHSRGFVVEEDLGFVRKPEDNQGIGGADDGSPSGLQSPLEHEQEPTEEDGSAGYDRAHPSPHPPTDFTSDDIDEAIQELLLKACARTVPASANPPDSEESAKAYVRRAAVNTYKSILRQKGREISFEETHVSRMESPRFSKSDALQARALMEHPPKPKSGGVIAAAPLYANVTKKNARDVLNDILRAFQEWVRENMRSQIMLDQRVPTEDYGRKETCLVAQFCRAVEALFDSLRQDAKVGFVQDFQRMLRLCFGFTDYKEEILEECKRKNITIKEGHKDPNYKKVRDSLDQRKHRLLGRLRDALLEVGLSKWETENIITAFLSKDTENME